MKKIIWTLAVFMGLVSCSPPSGEATEAQPLGRPDARTSALQAPPNSGTDSFAVQVFSVLAASQEGNFVFSPASLEALLRLLQQGARGGTAAELAALPMGKPGVRSAMAPAEANALFIAESLSLLPQVKADEIMQVPFATAPSKAVADINAWAARRTHSLISSIISTRDISEQTAFVAASAIYLKEKWLHPFPLAGTHNHSSFTREDGSTMHVAMMRCKATFHYAQGDDWAAVALPYNTEGRPGEPGYFIGILPKGSTRDFTDKLTPELYQNIRRELASGSAQEVIVYLPRFTLNPGTYSLKPALQTCGLKEIFSLNANFRGFSHQPLYLDNILQRCYIRADEDGTEAAAVTVAVARKQAVSPGPKPRVIAFNKPFIWVIGDLNSPAPPYFMGITREP